MTKGRIAIFVVYLLLLPLLGLLLYADILDFIYYFKTGQWEKGYDFDLPDFSHPLITVTKNLLLLISGICAFIAKKEKWIKVVFVAEVVFVLHTFWQIFLFMYTDPI